MACMDLKTYLKSLPDDEARAAFAESCGTTIGHMRNTLYDANKKLAPAVCVKAEKNSAGALMRWHLRPGDWHEIWPELRARKGAPSIPAAEAS